MIFIGGFRVELGNQKVEQAAFRIGNGLRVALEIDRCDGGPVLESLMRESVHVGGPEREILTNDELRAYGPAADGCVRWCFDWHMR